MAGLTTPVTLLVTVPVPAHADGANLVPNADVEQLDTDGQPVGWTDGSWGTNTHTTTVVTPGHGDTGHALRLDVTSFGSGSVQWLSPGGGVVANGSYAMSVWYEASVASEIVAKVTRANGSSVYFELAKAPAATTWAQITGTFVAPSDAVRVSVYQALDQTGYLVTDDYSVTATPSYGSGMVSVTFDDGLQSQYDNALPVLRADNLAATFYLISGLVGTQGYVSADEAREMYAGGQEIGSHTVTHPFLSELSATQVDDELRQSQADLETMIGAAVTDFAYPNGDFDPAVEKACLTYYASCRNSFTGWNTPAFRPGGVVAQYIKSTTTPAEVQSWIDQAKASKSWLVLMYHAVTPTPQGTYDTTPTDFAATMSYLQSSGLPVMTVRQARQIRAPLYTDSWTATDGSSWPVAWTTGSADGNVDVVGDAGHLGFRDVAGAYARAELTGLGPVTDSDTVLSYRWGQTTGTAYLEVFVRGSGGWRNSWRPVDGYGLELRPNAGSVSLTKSVAGVTTTLATVSGAQQVTTAKQWLRLQVAGTTVRFRIWPDGSPEPSTWAVSVTDADVTAAGQLFIALDRGASNVGAKDVYVDDLTVS